MMFTKRQTSILNTLSKSRPKERKTILTGVDNDIIRILAEIALNVLHGTVRLSQAQIRRLKRHKQILRALASKRIPIKSKRAIVLKQRGGFLPLLLPIVASALGGLFQQ
jgi:hypothetical protein